MVDNSPDILTNLWDELRGQVVGTILDPIELRGRKCRIIITHISPGVIKEAITSSGLKIFQIKMKGMLQEDIANGDD